MPYNLIKITVNDIKNAERERAKLLEQIDQAAKPKNSSRKSSQKSDKNSSRKSDKDANKKKSSRKSDKDANKKKSSRKTVRRFRPALL